MNRFVPVTGTDKSSSSVLSSFLSHHKGISHLLYTVWEIQKGGEFQPSGTSDPNTWASWERRSQRRAHHRHPGWHRDTAELDSCQSNPSIREGGAGFRLQRVAPRRNLPAEAASLYLWQGDLNVDKEKWQLNKPFLNQFPPAPKLFEHIPSDSPLQSLSTWHIPPFERIETDGKMENQE